MNEQEIRDLVLSSVREVINNPRRYGLTWRRLPATVVDSSDLSSVIVTIDGDSEPTEVPAVSLTGGYEVGARVLVDWVPPSGLYVMGTSPVSPSRGYQLVGTVYFTATTVIDPTSYTGIQAIRQRLVGGGGGGGGSAAPAVGNAAVGAGGGAGGFSEAFILTPFTAGFTVTVGAQGAGGSAGNNDGTAGGQTIGAGGFTGNGGGGGEGGAGGTGSVVTGGGTGGTATGDLAIAGSDGGNGMRSGGSVTSQGFGGASLFSGSRRPSAGDTTGAGISAQLYGAGGSGGFSQASTAAQTGGNGSAGLVVWDLYV